jgi:hypothetical protein
MCALKYASEALAMICICDKRCQARMMRDDNAREWATACRCACLAEKQSRMLVNRRIDLTIHTYANMSKQDQKTSIQSGSPFRSDPPSTALGKPRMSYTGEKREQSKWKCHECLRCVTRCVLWQ